MKVSEVSVQDARMCLQLINLLKAGRWELSGPDIAAHSDTVRWVQFLGNQIGEKLKLAEAPTGGMKVKAMGPIGTRGKKK